MFRRLAETVLILRWPLLMGLVFFTMITAGAMLRLDIDPSMETLFRKDSTEYKYYQEYRDRYGSDQMICVAMATDNIFSEPNLRLLDELTKKIAAYRQVERVLSLANAQDLKHKFMGVKVVPALYGVFDQERPLEEVAKEILTNELYVSNLISKDGKTASMLVYAKTPGKDTRAVGAFIEELRKLLASYENENTKFFIAGSPVEQYDFIKLIRRDQFTFVPLITLLLIIVTFLIYRSFACLVFSMSLVFMTVIWTIGTIVLVGQELNLMTSLLAPVIMINAVANAIHLMNLFFEIRPHHPSLRKCVVLTMQELGIPCFLTQFTTVLGFISLALNPIPAIRSFGLFSALGTFYAYILELLLTPILLMILPYRRVSESFKEGNIFNRIVVGFLEKLEFRWKWWVLILIVIALGFSLNGITQLEVDSNIVKQMKPDLPLSVSTRFIDEHLTGVYSLGFVLRRRDGAKITDYESLRMVDGFKKYLETLPGISKVNSITTLIKKIHKARKGDDEAYHIPEDEEDLRRYFKALSESRDPELWKMISKDFREIRLDARMRAVGTTQGFEIEQAAMSYLKSKMSRRFDYNQTGSIVLLGHMSKELVTQQTGSFGFAFLSITVLMMVFFNSISMGLLAAVPNLIPILIVYGLMGYLRIELSSATAMIASIVLGLVVDSSIHFLHRFRWEFSRRHHYLQSLHHTFRNVGQALVMSTLILVAGFASSIFANFRPTIHFGVLTSLTIFLSLLCTLVVLPVTIVFFKPFGSQRLFQRGSTAGHREQ